MRLVVAVSAALLLLSGSALAAPGDIDLSFGPPNGFVFTALTGSGGTTGDRVVVEPGSGRLLVNANHFDSAGSSTGVIRYLPDGRLDDSFNSMGQAGMVFDVFTGETNVRTNAMLRQPNGSVLIGGSVGGTGKFLLARFTSAGLPDSTFNSGSTPTGTVVTAFGTDDARIGGLALQSDGTIVAVGNRAGDLEVAPYSSTGAPGTAHTDPFTGVSSVRVGSALVLPDDRILAAGTATVAGVDRFFVARLKADGTPDTTFGSGGILTFNVGSPTMNDEASDLALEPDGSAVVAGTADQGVSSGDLALARVTPSGGLDPSFGSGGTSTLSISPEFDLGQALALQPNGKIVVAGQAGITGDGTGDLVVARFGPSGAPDTGFGSGGFTRRSLSPGADGAGGVALQADGNIVASGFAFLGSPGAVAVARFLGGERPAPAPPAAADRTKPRIGIRLLSTHLLKIRRGGSIRVRVSMSEAGTVTLTATVPVKTKHARRSRTVTLAKATARFTNAGSKTVKLKLGRKARRTLAAFQKTRLKLSVSASDLAGNRTKRSVTQPVRR